MSRALNNDKLSSVQDFLNSVAHMNCHQPEFLQAVEEVMESLWPLLQEHPQYARQSLLKRLVEPERIVIFRVCWIDDAGEV